MITLSDPSFEVIDSYNLRDSTLGRPLSRPATFMLGEDREILWRHLPDDWKVRNGPEAYMERFEEYRVGGGQ